MAQTNSARGSGARSIALLKLIAEIGDDFTLTEIAERARLPVSSVHRLLQPLLASGLAERAGGQRYRAGGEFLRVARMLLQNMDIGRIARPLIRELWDEWQETTVFCLYRPQAHKALILDIIPTPHPLRFVLEPATEVYLAWGSLGWAMLAHLPPDEREAAIKASPTTGPLSGEAPLSKREMEQELAKIRKRGAAVYRSERIDLAGVAAPVIKADGAVVGAIGLSLPLVRFPARKAAGMMRAVRNAATRLGKLAEAS